MNDVYLERSLGEQKKWRKYSRFQLGREIRWQLKSSHAPARGVVGTDRPQQSRQRSLHCTWSTSFQLQIAGGSPRHRDLELEDLDQVDMTMRSSILRSIFLPERHVSAM